MSAPIEQRALKIIAAFEAAGRIVRGIEIEGGKIKLDLLPAAPQQKTVDPDFIDFRRKSK